MTLISNWQSAWKFISVQIAAVVTVLGIMQSTMPVMQTIMSPTAYAVTYAILGALIAVGRVLSQPIFGLSVDNSISPPSTK